MDKTSNRSAKPKPAATNSAQGHVILSQLLDEIDIRNAPAPARVADKAATRKRRLAERKNQTSRPFAQDMVLEARHYNFFELLRRIELIEGRRVQSRSHDDIRDEFLELRSDNALTFSKSDVTRVSITDPAGHRLVAKRPGRTRVSPVQERRALDLSRTRKRARGKVLGFEREDRPLDQPWPYAATRYAVEVSFFGLHGTNSPLPSPTVEALAQGGKDGNTRKDFFDFFHHHWLKYVFQIWRKYRYAIAFEQGGADPFSQRVMALAGLYPKALRTLDDIPWSQLLGYVGLMMIRTKTPDVVANIVAKTFDLKNVVVREFYRQWVSIPRHQVCRLAVSNCTLGVDGSLGDRVLSHASKFVVEVGPVKTEVFFGLLPGQQRQKALKRMIEFLLRDQLSFDLLVRVDTSDWKEPALESSNDNQREALAAIRAPRTLGTNKIISLGRSQFLGKITTSEVHVQLDMGKK